MEINLLAGVADSLVGVSEWVLQPFLQLTYIIFVTGTLVLINALYQVFLFFSGSGFINQIFGMGAGGGFSINWSSPLAITFLSSIGVSALILFFMIGLTLVQNLFNTNPKQSPSFITKFKYVMYFFGAVIGIPVVFLFLNLVTSLLASVLGFNNSVRVDSVLINQTKQYLLPLLNAFNNFNQIQINGYDFNNYLDQLIAACVEQNKNAVLAGDTNLSNQLLRINDYLINIKQFVTSDMQLVHNEILAIINNMRVDHVNIDNADRLLSLIGQIQTFQTNLDNLNYELTNLLARYETTLDSNLIQLIQGFEASYLAPEANNLGFYIDVNQGVFNTMINGNNDFRGLFSIRTFLSGIKDFDLVLYIYRISNNNWTAVDWMATPSKVEYTNLFVGIIAALLSAVVIFMYTLYVTKRIFVLAIYFVISPIMIVSGVRDDGFAAANFAKTLVIKFSSIIFINIGMQIALIVTAGEYGLMNLVNAWDMNSFSKGTAAIVLIIAALLGGYATTSSITKMFGDDSSTMESVQDLMFITRGLALASIPLRTVAGVGLGGATQIAKKVPLTTGGKAALYASRAKNLQNLSSMNGNSGATSQAILSLRSYRSARKTALKDIKTSATEHKNFQNYKNKNKGY